MGISFGPLVEDRTRPRCASKRGTVSRREFGAPSFKALGSKPGILAYLDLSTTTLARTPCSRLAGARAARCASRASQGEPRLPMRSLTSTAASRRAALANAFADFDRGVETKQLANAIADFDHEVETNQRANTIADF